MTDITHVHTNSSAHACTFSLVYKITVSTLLGTTTLFAPVMNSILCFAILTTKQLRTTANILIASLSVSDILISLIMAPLEIIYVSLYPKWPLGKVETTVLNSVWMFSLVAPFVTVTVITGERYKTITSLRHYKRTIGWKPLVSALMFIWIYSISSVIFMALNFTTTTGEYYDWNVLSEYYYPFLGIHIVIPLIVIPLLYGRIILVTRTSKRNTVRGGLSNTAVANHAKQELQLAKSVGIVVGILFAVWLPVLVLEYFYATETGSCVVQQAGVISVWLTSSNGMINQLVYNYRNPILRKAIKNLFSNISASPFAKINDKIQSLGKKKHILTNESSATIVTSADSAFSETDFSSSQNDYSTTSGTEIAFSDIDSQSAQNTYPRTTATNGAFSETSSFSSEYNNVQDKVL